jgi:two-component system alkaline phosphatase synthesis response regulator PhoP
MPRHVLAVDDERHIRMLIEVNLERAGYRVTTACDGQEALDSIRTDRPDMVVLDVMMPRVDGFEVLRRLKADPETHEIPVLMLTAKAQDADVFHGWQSGADCYLTKPFNPAELVAWVTRTFEAGRSGEPEGRVYRL